MPPYTRRPVAGYRRRQPYSRLESAKASPIQRTGYANIDRYEGPYNDTQQPHWGQSRSTVKKSTAQAHYYAKGYPIDRSHHPSHSRTGHGSIKDDIDAAYQFEEILLRKNWRADHLAGRILRGLILRRAPLDDDALHNLLITTNKVFFNGALTGVTWRWSAKDDLRFETALLGTTCTESSPHSKNGHINLTIILSQPLLKRGRYDRDLLLSAFLHELIHCYLFKRCGIEHADMCDGHTNGFKHIAGVIERWIGDDRLHLRNMRARLEDFAPGR